MDPVSKRLDKFKISNFQVVDKLTNRLYKINYCDQIAMSRLIELNETLDPNKSFIVNNMSPDDVRKLVKMGIIKNIKNSKYQFDENFYKLLAE